MNYRAEITNALKYIEANPPVLPDVSDWPQSPSELASSSTTAFSVLNGEPDETTVSLGSETSPNQVIAKEMSLIELSALIQDCNDVIGTRVDYEQIRDFFEHESQHMAVARKLGAVGCEVGVALHILPLVGGTGLAYSMQPMINLRHFETTKLGAALVCSYPDVPSPGDLHDVYAMGYGGIDDIADRILSQDKWSQYPLPLSYDYSQRPLR